MNRHASLARPPALVIGGMHRSTTSLAASILAAAGLHLGDDLMAAGTGNEAGHFEDNDFYMLHQRILAANGLSMEGYTCAERIDIPAPAQDEAVALVARRRAAGRAWGWKDPRTVLFLDFWADLLPEARWLFVVRSPWEVVDSLFRRGDTAFRSNPRFAADVWVAYNRRILEFVQTHPDQAAVVSAADVIADQAGFVQVAAGLLGTPLETPPERFRPDLFVGGQPPQRAGLVRAAAPEAYEIYRSLLDLAGATRRDLERAGNPPRLADVAAAGLIEWNKACQAIAERGGFSAQAADARQAVEAIAEELATEREAGGRIQLHVDELTRDLVAEREARAEATAYAEHLAQELATERAARAEVTASAEAAFARLDSEHAARADLTCRLEQRAEELTAARAMAAADRQAFDAEIAAAREMIATHQSECESRLAVSDREWSSRLKAERARRETETDRLSARLSEACERADRLAEERDAAWARLDLAEAAREETVARLEAERNSLAASLRGERDALVARLEAERNSLAASLGGERDALAAQLEAERGIYEMLRQDLTGRIEVARRKAG